MNKKVIYIGGSPCSGKSTIAERIQKDYDAYYLKADDYLEELIATATECNMDTCKKVSDMTADEIWVRDPIEQCSNNFNVGGEVRENISECLYSGRKLQIQWEE